MRQVCEVTNEVKKYTQGRAYELPKALVAALMAVPAVLRMVFRLFVVVT